MRRLTGCATVLLLLLTAGSVSAATHRLWLKDARRVTARIARHDVQTSRAPASTTATPPVCKRLSPRHATCRYTLDEHQTDASGNGPHILCKRKVDVRLVHGHARGRLLPLNCYGNDNPDYEP